MVIISRECFRNMTDILQNDVIARMWFDISASNGYETAKTNRDTAESEMSSARLAKAKELALECVKKNYKDCG